VLDIGRLLLQILIILAASRAVGGVFRAIGQPKVVGEMFAGIFLGPSLLGWFAPKVSAVIFPAASLGYLNTLSQIGLVIFMFLVGMNINPNELKSQGHAAVLASHASISFPFVLAALFSLYLYPRLAEENVSFASFGLFMGTAMSITAFPVLARILAERKMLQSRIGTIAVACAAVDDVTGWCILGYVVFLIRSAHDSTSFRLLLGGTLLFVLAMIFGVRKLVGNFERAYRKHGSMSENQLVLLFLLTLGSALCTEWMGIHPLFGAFLLGAVMPKEPRFVAYVSERLHAIVILLLPLFFAFTGLRTSVHLIKGSEMWTYCALIVLVATVGKFGGSALASQLCGMPLRESLALGILMNTRGLMELVVLNIGLEIHVISPTLFSMMVIMALVTTFMTTPLLAWTCSEKTVQVANEIPEKAQAICRGGSAA